MVSPYFAKGSNGLLVAGDGSIVFADGIVSIGLGRRWFSQGVRVRSTDERWREVFIYVRRPKELIDLIERQRTQVSVGNAIVEKRT